MARFNGPSAAASAHAAMMRAMKAGSRKGGCLVSWLTMASVVTVSAWGISYLAT